MRKITLFLFILLVAMSRHVAAQSGELDVTGYIKMLEEGKADQVKADLLSLVAKYQNHPGVLYLQGRLASDGVEAMKMYQSILDNFPQSEWADDALYHMYQYYYSLGLYRTADLKLQQLRKEYPSSPFVTGKATAKTPLQEEPAPKVISTTPTPVEKPPMLQAPTATPRTPTPSSGGAYAIQVGAFSTMGNAEKLKSFFEDLGYSVEIQNKVRGGRSLFLVWVGSFATADDARKFAEEVKRKHNIESLVVMR
jgi:cell division septation protein DedD